MKLISGVVGIVIGTVAYFVIVMLVFGSKSPPKRCSHSLPALVAEYNSSVHVVTDTLYLCFQQGKGVGMTETVCVPMEDCEQ